MKDKPPNEYNLDVTHGTSPGSLASTTPSALDHGSKAYGHTLRRIL